MTIVVRQSLGALALMAVMGALPAAGQSVTAGSQSPAGGPPAGAQAPAAPPAPVAGFQDGFFVQTNGGDNRLVFGLVLQTDGRFSLDDPNPITDTFTIRKARPTFTGRVARYFDFKVMPDFGNGTATLVDAYFDVRFSPKFRIRTGKDKTPVGYELLIGDAFLFFPERSLASSLVPNRDVGIQVQGDLGAKFYYAGGVFNGVPDGTSSSTDVDVNSGKDVAGRLVVQPFRTSGTTTPGALSGFGFQVGGTVGKQSGALPTFRTSVGQTYFSYASGVTADDTRARITPSLFYYYRSLGVFGEYVRSTQRVARTGETQEFANQGWDITAAYLLTGETASLSYTRPRSPFDPPTGKWGALQVLARYSELKLDDDIFRAGYAAAGASKAARQFTAGVNWYPVPYIKYYATYERTEFANGTGVVRPTEHVVLFRVQLGI